MNKTDEMIGRMNAPLYAKRPAPETLRVRHVINPREMEHARYDFDNWCKWLKSHMARQIAEYIVDKCGILQVPADYRSMQDGTMIEMEFTINDASVYNAWLPAERRRGIEEGRVIEQKNAPYGLTPGEFYE